MNDKELLKLAAKAAGFIYKTVDDVLYVHRKRNPKDDWYGWNPLTDDGDALRLAVKLNIPVIPYDDETSTGTNGVVGKNWGSKEANTRRAIFKAAAEIGKGMK